MKLLRQDAIEDYSRGYVSFINQILEITKNNNIDLVIIRDAWVVGKNMTIKLHPKQKLCMYDATFEGEAV
ncbi:MAG: hypothetical protein HRU35_07930 [Rickettsiaceae bacterium]|nr:hypothetical protein [Rickettsiaceae bacterium]